MSEDEVTRLREDLEQFLLQEEIHQGTAQGILASGQVGLRLKRLNAFRPDSYRVSSSELAEREAAWTAYLKGIVGEG